MCEKVQKDPLIKYAVNDTSVQATSPEDQGEEHLTAKAQKAKKHAGGLKLLSGNGSLCLSLKIVKSLGINMGNLTVGRFANGEVNV